MRRSRTQQFQRCILGVFPILALLVASLGGCSLFPSEPSGPRATPQLLTRTPTRMATATPKTADTATPSSPATETQIPRPHATATPTVCPDEMTAVLQLDPQPGSSAAPVLVQAGEVLRAGWRIKNTGGCTWDTAYLVQFSGPQNPGWTSISPPTRLPRSIRPGETMDLWVEAIVPPSSGVQTASWQLVNGRGDRVGELLTLVVETAALPTRDRQAARWFEIIPDSVQPGERAALSWSMQNAKAVYLDGPGITDARIPLETAASRYVFPSRTSKYNLKVVNGDDSIDHYSVTVEVEPFTEPRIRTFDVYQVEASPQCLQIEWTTQNRVNRVLIYRNGEIIWDGVVDDGAIRDCPPTGRVVYILEIYGPGGTDSATRTIDLE